MPADKRSLPPEYVRDVERLVALIPEWIAAFEGLPDLRFYHPGDKMLLGGLDSPMRRLLAKSDDALALLAWLDECSGRVATLFQAFVALDSLGFMVGAEPLTLARMKELGFSPAGFPQRGGSA